MRRYAGHRGSALLIVLGMLAFMVVSAVSFAVYMRQSRAPSSYLRRSSTSRFMLKSALAQAIARIDGCHNDDEERVEGIYDDFYPGLSSAGTIEENGNYWVRRVFTPFGQLTEGSTVATLTLEALAYLPPAIINEVRVYSRKTRTAEWRNLPYDMGRYAFCAVDVSDCFDINKVRAGSRRSSQSNERITLASLYRDHEKDIDKVLNKVGEVKPAYYISMADYNLLQGASSVYAPFMQNIGKKNDAMYVSNKTTANTISNALFITDTWFPPTNGTKTASCFNLEVDENRNQPFRSSALKKTDADILSIDENKTELAKVLMTHLGGIGLACLHDYLDRDNRPISFCIPTVETAPMVCGIGLCHGDLFAPKVACGSGVVTGTFSVPDSKDKDKTHLYTRVAEPYELSQFVRDNTFPLSGTLAYPFRRTGATKDQVTETKQKFSVEVLVKIFFAPHAFKCRVDADSPLYPANKWEDSVANGIVTKHVTAEKITLSKAQLDCVSQEDAVIKWHAVVNLPNIKGPLFWYVYCKDENNAVVTAGSPTSPTSPHAPYYSLDGIRDDSKAFCPYDAKGKVADWWTNAKPDNNNAGNWVAGGTWNRLPAQSTLGTEKYVPHVAVWVRVLNADGKTVDMVPARLTDDLYWGERQISKDDAQDLPDLCGAFGRKTPILDFRGDADLAFKYAFSETDKEAVNVQLNGEKANTFSAWNMMLAPDPRYNWAPESWLVRNKGDGTVMPQHWLDVVTPLLGKDDRDKDIFLFTSDQEYLQSAGELAFLPELEDLDGTAKMFEGVYPKAMAAALAKSDDLASQDTTDGLAGYDFFWRTYSTQSPDYNIYAMKDCEIVTGQNDFRVNPFSSDSRILDAAFAETPFDYHVASINKECFPDAEEDVKTFRKKYVFESEDGYEEAKLTAEQVHELSRTFSDRMREVAADCYDRAPSTSKKGEKGVAGPNRFSGWEELYNALDWEGSGKGDDRQTFLGVNLDQPLFGVDRKFLHSYWRSCFQNRQQLFLVFIRAEPLTTGGMGKGSLAASQLGARGVALVWRDPLPPAKGRSVRKKRTELTTSRDWRTQNESSGPHRTRILFYHQFE